MVMQRVVLVGVLMCRGCRAGNAPVPPPALPPAAAPLPAAAPVAVPSLSVQLVDGKTRAILAGVTATVTSPRGSWEGRADAEGGVHVPPDILADEMMISTKGYRTATVKRNVGRRPKRVVTVRLIPE